uniref:Uncharacterized protein n=2 Tax=Amphimedon queenslandica TaxID=400682 RepID=A0A1X7TY99_AMPQE
VFYYTLANIAPKLCSKLRAIQLFAIAKTSIILKYVADIVLKKFMEDFEVLEKEGLTLEIVSFVIRGTVVIASGDNLGSTYIGGYKAPSSAFRKCQHCIATADDMNKEFNSHSFIPRTQDTHDHHIRKGLAPDVMHDVLEGVTQYEVKELLKHLIGEKVITVDTLNGTIETFPYCYSDVQDKPTLISQTTLNSSDHSEKQKVRFLPIMIGHKISRSDPHWQNFLLLCTIIDVILAPVLSSSIMISYLAMLIEDHHTEFIKLYFCAITPKFHYMVTLSRMD